MKKDCTGQWHTYGLAVPVTCDFLGTGSTVIGMDDIGESCGSQHSGARVLEERSHVVVFVMLCESTTARL